MVLDYKKLMLYCIKGFFKADIYLLLKEFSPETKLPSINKIKMGELYEKFLNAISDEQIQTIHERYPEKFGFTNRDVYKFFGVRLSDDQMHDLSDMGKIKKVGVSRSPVSSFEAGMFDAIDISRLSDEDFRIPDLPRMINQTDIRNMYGWTQTMIDKFLSNPVLRQNPFYKSGSPQKLWKRTEVEAVMETKEFKAEFEKAKKRRIAANAAVKTKKDKLMAEVEGKIKEISVQVLPQNVLENQVLQDKQDWYDYIAAERGREPKCAYDADNATLTRWAVNYIRHCLTDYDEDLYEMSGRVGCHEAYTLYRTSVLDAIAKAYPHYKNECKRQVENTELPRMCRV